MLGGIAVIKEAEVMSQELKQQMSQKTDEELYEEMIARKALQWPLRIV